MKQDIENIIKNLPKYKNGSKAIPKDDIVVQYSALSLIADEVLKVVVEKIREFKCEVPPTPNNLGKIYTEEMVNKVIKYVGRFNYNKALDDLLSNLFPNKENE